MCLSLIIINWNTRDLLAQCLESVAKSVRTFERSNGLPRVRRGVQTCVVDNASTDGSAEMVRERFPWVHLIENTENVGFARANNQALKRSSGRYVLLLNSDAMLGANSLANLVAFADSHPQAGIIGVKLLNADGSFQAALNDFPSPFTALLEGWGIMQALQKNPYYPSYTPLRSQRATTCDWVGGACLLARSKAIRQVGLLDETFFMNSEEVDWCYRMWESGWEVWYTPDVEVVHLGGGSANRRSAAQRMRLYAGKVRFLEKHYGAFAAHLARISFRLSSGVKSLAYQARFLIKRREADAMQSKSHWHVFRCKNWI